MKKRPSRPRELAAVLGLVISFGVAGGLLGALKNAFPHSTTIALLSILAMLTLWAYILDYILKNLHDEKPRFFWYLQFYFWLAIVVIFTFGLFLDPWPNFTSYVDNLPDSILTSALGFCTLYYDPKFQDHSAWSLILPAETLISFSLIALVFGAVIQREPPPGVDAVGADTARASRPAKRRNRRRR